MAGDDKGDRIVAEGLPDRARRFGATNAPGDLAVGGDAAVWDLQRGQQHPALKLRERAQVERQIEPGAPAGEVLAQLLADAAQLPRRALSFDAEVRLETMW